MAGDHFSAGKHAKFKKEVRRVLGWSGIRDDYTILRRIGCNHKTKGKVVRQDDGTLLVFVSGAKAIVRLRT